MSSKRRGGRIAVGALAGLAAICIGLGIWVVVDGTGSDAAGDYRGDVEFRAASGVTAPEAADLPEVDAGPRGSHDIAELADADWVAATAAATGIPERALQAYAGAALRAGDMWPACGLGWNTLAAIGEVETHHGTIQGGSIGDDGVADPAIIGIALDGSSTDAITDTDGGELDGDAEWDRAIGPMQFIPETWQALALDGNGDGVLDPQQIDDAALTAAAALCGPGGDLTDPAVWIDAVAGYNSATSYNNRVAEAANAYAQ